MSGRPLVSLTFVEEDAPAPRAYGYFAPRIDENNFAPPTAFNFHDPPPMQPLHQMQTPVQQQQYHLQNDAAWDAQMRANYLQLQEMQHMQLGLQHISWISSGSEEGICSSSHMMSSSTMIEASELSRDSTEEERDDNYPPTNAFQHIMFAQNVLCAVIAFIWLWYHPPTKIDGLALLVKTCLVPVLLLWVQYLTSCNLAMDVLHRMIVDDLKKAMEKDKKQNEDRNKERNANHEG